VPPSGGVHRYQRHLNGLLLGVLCGAGSVSGCSVDDLDFAGKRCSASEPCPSTLSCVSGVCERCAGDACPATCSGKFPVENFGVAWQTPNSVHWRWSPGGTAADFVQYKLVLGRTQQDLEQARSLALAGEPEVQPHSIWTQLENPELGQYELRLSGGTDAVSTTTTDSLEPATEYRARLLAYDSSGCVFESTDAVARTPALTSLSFALFDDAPQPAGRPRPDGAARFETDPGAAYQGDTFVLWPGWGAEAGSAGYENVGVYQLGTTPELHYPSLDFSAGYLELAVAVEGSGIAAWGEVRLVVGPSGGGCSGIEAAAVKPYALRPGGYQLLQLPLSAFQLAGAPLGAAALQDRAICEVSVGRTWAPGEAVRVDAIRLRW